MRHTKSHSHTGHGQTIACHLPTAIIDAVTLDLAAISLLAIFALGIASWLSSRCDAQTYTNNYPSTNVGVPARQTVDLRTSARMSDGTRNEFYRTLSDQPPVRLDMTSHTSYLEEPVIEPTPAQKPITGQRDPMTYPWADPNYDPDACSTIETGMFPGYDLYEKRCVNTYCETAPWKLLPRGAGGIDFDFWIEAGGYGNQYGDQIMGQWSTVSHNNGVVVNQVWASIHKDTCTQGCGFQLGGKVDFLFGSDAGVIANPDWDSNWFTSRDRNAQPFYGFAMPQIYGEMAINNFTARVGHFFTLLGYESVAAPYNFFYSHGYLFRYAEPFSNTGAMLEYHGIDQMTLAGGYITGWDLGFGNPGEGGMFQGLIGYEFAPCLGVSYAVNGGKLGTQGNLYMQTITIRWDMMPDMHYVLTSDMACNTDVPTGTDRYWGGIGQYLTHDVTDKLAAGLRLEWYYDPDGRLNTATPGDFWTLTFGLNYRPCANVTFRPELRYDWYNGRGAPFNNSTNKQVFGGGYDLVVTW